jgi:uncharacterized protein YbjT (DUF2867 family)
VKYGPKLSFWSFIFAGMNQELVIKSSTKQAVVFGASGLIGGFCLEYLLNHPAYSSVLVFGRRVPGFRHEKMTALQVDFENMEAWAGQIRGDDLFICLGTTMKKAGSKKAFYHVEYDYITDLVAYAELHRMKQVMLVSAMGADSSSVFFYNQVKGKIEESVRCRDFWSIHIFRPSVLIGSREEVRPLESFAAGAGMALRVLGPKLFAGITPIEGEKVALSMVRAAQGTRSGVFYYPSQVMAKMGKKEQN